MHFVELLLNIALISINSNSNLISSSFEPYRANSYVRSCLCASPTTSLATFCAHEARRSLASILYFSSLHTLLTCCCSATRVAILNPHSLLLLHRFAERHKRAARRIRRERSSPACAPLRLLRADDSARAAHPHARRHRLLRGGMRGHNHNALAPSLLVCVRSSLTSLTLTVTLDRYRRSISN